jgi:hypothetical protein
VHDGLMARPVVCGVTRWVLSLDVLLQGGSVAHIMRYRYPDGLQEAVIATIMKEVGQSGGLIKVS